MRWFRRGDLLDRTFLIGITIKGIDGVLEEVGGLALQLADGRKQPPE